MDIEDAIALILGDDLAETVIRNQGLEWGALAAEAKITNDEDPKAVATVVAWLSVERALGVLARAR